MSKRPPAARPIAFLSDVHGNLAALEAVLAEVAQRGVEEIVVCGDLLLGGDQPLEVFRRLQQVHAQCVRGLSDSALASLPDDRLTPRDATQAEHAERFRDTRRALGELALRFLQKLPETLRIPLVDGREIVAVHGSPADPTTEMSHDLSDEEMLALVGDDPADIVVCGASHVPFQRELPEVRVLGLGSVGAAPEGRVAHFAIVSPRMDGTLIEQAWVEY